jgi:hypothetical protein
MKTKLTSITATGLVTLALSSTSMAGEIFEFAGQKYNLRDNQPEQARVIEQFEVAGQKYSVTVPLRGGETGAELSAFELQLDQNLIYGDDDYSIVETGAR